MGGPGTPPFWRTRKELCTARRYGPGPGTRLGDLKENGFLLPLARFSIKHSTHTGTRLGDLKENWFPCFPIKHSTHTFVFQLNTQHTLPPSSPQGLLRCLRCCQDLLHPVSHVVRCEFEWRSFVLVAHIHVDTGTLSFHTFRYRDSLSLHTLFAGKCYRQHALTYARTHTLEGGIERA